MDDPLPLYTKIQELVQNEARKIATEVYNTLGTQYGVAEVPTHTHNGVDSLQITPYAVTGFLPLPSTEDGVVSPAVLRANTVIQGNSSNSYTNQTVSQSPTLPIYPIPIIYGGGGTESLTFTGSRPTGSTSGTLTAPYGGSTGTYVTLFNSSGELVNAHFINGSATATWSPDNVYATGTGVTIVGDSIFHGGEAPPGSMVVFSNFENLAPTLYIRVPVDTYTNRWWGVDLTLPSAEYFNL